VSRLVAIAFLLFIPGIEAASPGCVWKVTTPSGAALFLGGSVHALRKSDYPLPAAYNRAFDSSSRLAFEVEPKALASSSAGLAKAGNYPKGDSLKNHVDPRTYDYLRRLFGLMRVPEQKFSRYRPWMLVLMLSSPSMRGLSEDLGVDEFIMKRARANGKQMVGLESAGEHSAVFSGLTDRQSEALLLITFIPLKNESGDQDTMNAWLRGDVDELARTTRAAYQEFPAFGERILGARNRNWMPKLESYLKSGQTYFVVVGAAHLGGGDGLLAMLRARNYKVERL
jgi:uncharacterized protein YbaP (TraB family)